MIVINAGHTQAALARNGIGWSTTPRPVSSPLMTPTRVSSIHRQIRIATIGGVAHGTSISTRQTVCSRYFLIVRLVRSNARPSPARRRTVTPTAVNQMTVFHSNRRKSGLVTSSM